MGALLAWTGRLLFFWGFSTAGGALLGRGSISGGLLWTGGEGDKGAGFVSLSPAAGTAASLISVTRWWRARGHQEVAKKINNNINNGFYL